MEDRFAWNMNLALRIIIFQLYICLDSIAILLACIQQSVRHWEIVEAYGHIVGHSLYQNGKNLITLFISTKYECTIYPIHLFI